MKIKKWNRITLISLLVIVAEIGSVFLVVMPAVKSNNIFKYIEAGKDKKAAGIYDELSSNQKSRVRDKLDDFGTYQVNQYIEGSKNYDEVMDSLQAAYQLDSKKTPDIMDTYIGKAASLELIDIYDRVSLDYAANGSYYTDVYSEGSSNFSSIYGGLNYSYSDDTMGSKNMADQELVDYLNSVYDDYKSGTVDLDTMTAYAKVGMYLFNGSSDEYWLASGIDDDLYYVKMYQEAYETAKGYYDDEDYFGCVDYCDDELKWYFNSEDDTTGYKDKFTVLRQDAYDTGKTFYISKAEEMINGGDADGGKELLYKIENRYGDEVDTSSAWELTRSPWMTPYVEYMKNWEENLKADVVSGVTIGSYDNPAALDMSEYLPEYIYLYDIDGNGTPELMLRADSYTYYIYTYDGAKVAFTGAVRIASMVGGGKVLAEPISMPEEYIQGYELLSFNGSSWSVEEYYMTDGENYIVNGEASTMEVAEEMHDRFYDMQTDTYLDYDYIDDYEDFIYSYE